VIFQHIRLSSNLRYRWTSSARPSGATSRHKFREVRCHWYNYFILVSF